MFEAVPCPRTRTAPHPPRRGRTTRAGHHRIAAGRAYIKALQRRRKRKKFFVAVTTSVMAPEMMRRCRCRAVREDVSSACPLLSGSELERLSPPARVAVRRSPSDDDARTARRRLPCILRSRIRPPFPGLPSPRSIA